MTNELHQNLLDGVKNMLYGDVKNVNMNGWQGYVIELMGVIILNVSKMRNK